MTSFPSPGRPWPVKILAAGLMLLFLGFLTLFLAAGFNLPALSLAQVVSAMKNNFNISTIILLILTVCPFSAGLILAGRALGHRLALALLGFLLLQTGSALLDPYTWDKPSPVFAWAPKVTLILFVFYGILFYLALRPETFAAIRPDRD